MLNTGTASNGTASNHTDHRDPSIVYKCSITRARRRKTSNMNVEQVKEMVDAFKAAVEKLPSTVTRTNHVQMPMLNWEGTNPQKEFRIW